MLKNKEIEYILLFKNEIHSLFIENKNDVNVQIVVISGCKKVLFNQIRLPFEIYRHKADWYLFLAFPVPILLFKRNMVSTIHDICCWDCPETMNGLSNWYFKISHKIAMWKCERILTISKFSENRIVDRLRYPKDKIWLIYCGVEKKFLNFKRNQEEDKKVRDKYNLPVEYFLSLSTLEPRKNLRLLVDAYRELVMNDGINMPLVLAGRKGWHMDKFLNGIEEKVQKQIMFTGFIDDEDLPAVYGNASLFVFPSRYEGFGMPPLEAIACGTDVLSSDATSLPEVLGEASSYFMSEDKEDLIQKLIEKSNYKENKGLLCSQVNQFSWETEAKKLLTFMEQR